jgi:hypothetical protein
MQEKQGVLQFAEKLNPRGFVTGHDFSRAEKCKKNKGFYSLRKNSTQAAL